MIKKTSLGIIGNVQGGGTGTTIKELKAEMIPALEGAKILMDTLPLKTGKGR